MSIASNRSMSSASPSVEFTACVNPNPTKARVIIVGAGIGGLTLAALLERAGIEYQIFERAAMVKPLGSALSIGSNVMPLFKQLGILDEILANAKPFSFSTGYNEQREATRTLDYSPAETIGGYLPHIISRPILVDILLKLVPASKITFSKKILSCKQDDEGVTIACSDNSAYQADIIVGADGAYSGVRQNLYKQLLAKGQLPKSDNADLPFNSTCLVGQTRPLDPEVFKHLSDSHTWFETIIGENKPYAWITFTTKFNTICWMVLQHLDEVSSKESDTFRNTEWGPEAAETMCKQVRDFPIPRNGMTLGDLIDNTPKEYISKVMLEEKLFDTWYGGRMVLLGDGLGAVSAMQDAVTLANCLYELSEYPTTDEIAKAFKHYQTERYPLAKSAYDTSHRLAMVVGQSWYNDVFRALMKWMPKSLFTRSLSVMYSYRPQASFLPPVKDLGMIKPAPQASLARARANAAARASRASSRRASSAQAI
ncbi:hypothetical protein BGZ70_008267 [Mortierella alpina]|uniref:FAD-binding domain-containing protein n=1 Tax=Mortierella alpina TaxID=64518 RepID=A0A9P6J3V2_MORAP|nr:hypothetical protein BGZ70_008267 [Mortierella alpina]